MKQWCHQKTSIRYLAYQLEADLLLIYGLPFTFATEMDVEGSDVEGMEEMQLKQVQRNIWFCIHLYCNKEYRTGS